MSLAIIIAFACLMLFLLGILAMLSNLDAKHPTKSLPPAPVKKSIAEMLKEALASPPIGCMWEVKKVIKHNRRLPDGRMIFDGTIEKDFAEITLITPYGRSSSFSLMVDDDNFEHSLKFNTQAVLNKYNHELKAKTKTTETGWDGVYN